MGIGQAILRRPGLTMFIGAAMCAMSIAFLLYLYIIAPDSDAGADDTKSALILIVGLTLGVAVFAIGYRRRQRVRGL